MIRFASRCFLGAQVRAGLLCVGLFYDCPQAKSLAGNFAARRRQAAIAQRLCDPERVLGEEKIMSAGRKPFVLVAAIAALVVGFRGTVQAAPTTVTVPNYDFHLVGNLGWQPYLNDGQLSGPNMYIPYWYGARRRWNWVERRVESHLG